MNFKEFPLFIVFVEGGNVLMINTKRRMDFFFPVSRCTVVSHDRTMLLLCMDVFLKHWLVFPIYIFKANRFFVGKSYNFMRNEDGINTT